MRFAMRSRRGPHAPIGHNATKVQRIVKRARLGGGGGDAGTLTECVFPGVERGH